MFGLDKFKSVTAGENTNSANCYAHNREYSLTLQYRVSGKSKA